jgi:hypothetical protein
MRGMQGITKLIAGDSLDFTTSVASYPATDGWTLKYVLAPRFTTPAQSPITLTAATYEVTGYRVQVGPSRINANDSQHCCRTCIHGIRLRRYNKALNMRITRTRR